jgi:hypothetical protein
MLKVTLSETIAKGLLSGKKVYLVTKRCEDEDLIIFESFSKKESYLKADFEANNKADLSDEMIVLTTFEKCGIGYSISELYINEKTLKRTINSKKFKSLK